MSNDHWHLINSNNLFETIILTFFIIYICTINAYASQEVTGNGQPYANSEYWIYSVDSETEEDNNKTDMTDVIIEMLEENGYCHLGPGIFYVRGNINMPFDSTIEGCGKETVIQLLSDSSCDYIFKPIRNSSIKNMTLSGSYTSPDLSDFSIGNKSGIYFTANADGKEEQQDSVLPCMLNQLWIENFNGSGIYCHNTGGGLKESLIVDNCYIEKCKAGINIDYYSEYHKFSNININKCYYACINNGGNNIFSSCTFHGTIGFLIDNTDGTKRNIAHGSVVGCTFNHTDNWNNPSELGCGDAIVINNSNNGFVFTGCQIWYGQIKIYNSKGISFSDCLIGGSTPKITVKGENPVYFNNCTFYQSPELNINCSSRFNSCNCVLSNSEVINSSKHTFDNGTIIKNPSCKEEGVTSYKCIDCGLIKEVPIERTDIHSLQYNKKEEPSCTDNGTEHYWSCSVCNKLFSDADGIKEISSPIVIKATGHKPALLSSISPTCNQNGLSTGIYCTVCNKTLVEQKVIEPVQHILLKKEKVEPTCTEDGIECYWTCLLCNQLFSDPNGNSKINIPKSIKATEHDFNNGAVTKKASLYETGIINYICQNNNSHTKTHTIPKLNLKVRLRKTNYIIKANILQKKNRIIKKPIKVTCTESSYRFKKEFGDKHFKINKKTGTVTIRKGIPKGSYIVITKVTTVANKYYNSSSKIAIANIKIQ